MSAQLMEQPAMGRVLLDEPAEVYHKRVLGEANTGGLKLLAEKSAAHYHHWATSQGDDEEESKTLKFGRAFHCATLEPEVFARTYIVLPSDAPDRPTAAMLNATGKRTPNSQMRIDWWSDFMAVNKGKELVSAKDYDRCLRMADSVRNHPVGRGMIAGGKREVTLRWEEPVALPDGDVVVIPCKARVDNWLDELHIFVDPKSTVDANPEVFARAIPKYGYHIQHVHYFTGARYCGLDVRQFLFLAVESAAPWVCTPNYIRPPTEELGIAKRAKAMQKLALSVRSGRYAGYTDGIVGLDAPAYAHYESEHEEITA